MKAGAPDIVVVGGGIVGASCAHALAEAGLSVTVFDAREGGATNAGMGHLVVMDDDPAEFSLSASSMPVWHAWGARMRETAPACAYVNCGTVWVAADAAEMAEAERKQARLSAGGVASRLLTARELADAEPALRGGLAGGLLVPGDGIVYAPNVAAWLLARQPERIRVREERVTGIDARGVTLAGGGRCDAGAVVLAAGTASTHLCPELPVVPKKGHLAITDRYPGFVHHQLVELGYVTSAHNSSGTSVACNVQPRPTGQVFLGSSRQFDSTATEVDGDVLARMLQRALDYLPGLADLDVIRTWTGFRPATPDGLPLIGRHPWRENLWLATGHEGLGVTTAPATAQLLAALLTDAAPALDAHPFSPERFDLEVAA